MCVGKATSAHQVSKREHSEVGRLKKRKMGNIKEKKSELGAQNAAGRHENVQVCKMLKLHNIFSHTLS